MSRWTACAGCVGDRCNSSLLGDECQGHIIRPHDPEDGPCPYFTPTGCYPDKLPECDLGGRTCAVTDRMARIIERGINTRNFSYWPVSLYVPTIGDEIMTNGECVGFYVSTRPYGKRDTIYARGQNFEIDNIKYADIRENRLVLSTDTWWGSSLTIDIVAGPPVATHTAVAAQAKAQKSLEDWA